MTSSTGRTVFLLAPCAIALSCGGTPLSESTAAPEPVVHVGGPTASVSGNPGDDPSASGSANPGETSPASEAPIRGEAISPYDVMDFSMGAGQDCVLRRDGKIICWLPATDKNGLNVGKTIVQVIDSVKDPIRVSAGRQFACAVQGSDHRLACWGSLTTYVAGRNGAIVSSVMPLDPAMDLGPIAADVTDVATSSYGGAFCALNRKGEVWCWGGGTWQTPTLLTSDGPRRIKMGLSESSVWAAYDKDGATTWRLLNPAEPTPDIVASDLSPTGGFEAYIASPQEVAISGYWPYSAAPFSVGEDLRGVKIPNSQHWMCAHGDHLYCLGNPDWGMPKPFDLSFSRATRIDGIPGNIKHIEAGWDYVCALNDHHEIWCFGTWIPGKAFDSREPVAVGVMKLDVCNVQ